MALSVQFDHAQKRNGDDRIGVFAHGAALDALTDPECWTEPVTNTLVIRPYQLRPAWYTSATGDNAKLGLSDFGLSSTDWEVHQDQMWAGPWICRKDAATNAAAISTTTYAKNRGWYVSWFVYSSDDRYAQLRVGWNGTGSATTGIVVTVYSNGDTEVHEDGVLIGRGSIGPLRANDVANLLLLPGRQRELLVIGNAGQGFQVVLDDIDPADTNPVIVPASKFFVHILQGRTQFQASPLRFPTSAVAISEKLEFLEAPAAGEPLETFVNDAWIGTESYLVFGHPAFVGTQNVVVDLRDWAGGAFVANGSNTQVRLRATLSTTDQGYTPFLYASHMAYTGTVATTASAAVNVTSSTVGPVLISVPDTPGGTAARLVLRDPDTLAGTVPAITTQVNRPIRLRLGSVDLLDGLGGMPSRSHLASDAGERLDIEVASRWKLLAEYRFQEPVMLDGTNFADALKFLARRAGFEAADCSVSTTSFVIPNDIDPKRGFGTLIEPGDTAEDWVLRLLDTYAPNWVCDIRPKPGVGTTEFYALSPTDLGTTAARTLYRTTADAISIGGVPAAEAVYNVCWDLQTSVLEPLANSVRVTGLDTRRQRPLMAHKRDAASQAVATAPGSRPENWLGVNRPYGLVDPAITSQEAVNEACTVIYDRFTQLTHMAQWTCDLLLDDSGVPLWRGANVRIHGLGTYQILAFDGSLDCEDADPVRQFTYVGRRVATEP